MGSRILGQVSGWVRLVRLTLGLLFAGTNNFRLNFKKSVGVKPTNNVIGWVIHKKYYGSG